MKFTHYLALGDSISIDLYPSLDETLTPDKPLGAASVLAQRLRETHNPRLTFINLTKDGAMIRDALEQARRADRLSTLGAELLVTLTAGGNDISFNAMNKVRKGTLVEDFLNEELPKITKEWSLLVADLVARFPGATIIVNTSYDPTEGTGTFGGVEVAGAWEGIAHLYTPGRRVLSEFIREAVKSITETMKVRLLLADIRSHFEGHGVTTSVENRWYYDKFMIEPNAEGARQIAGLWMQALEKQALVDFAKNIRPAHASIDHV